MKERFFHCALTFRCSTTKSTHLITSLRRHFPFIHCQLNHKLLWFSHTCDFTGESNTVTSSDFSLSYPDIKFKFPHRRRICVWNLQEFDFSFKLLIWRFIDSKHTALNIISLRQFRQMKHFHYEQHRNICEIRCQYVNHLSHEMNFSCAKLCNAMVASRRLKHPNNVDRFASLGSLYEQCIFVFILGFVQMLKTMLIFRKTSVCLFLSI